ncbi:hypothetical protein B0H65DRAFT_148681 [Neurospora tetraspora]|uniref:Uncharacterized protein n=1 Tax=Neurospora tetraspora TaxID=94610 RepID=A0AAE0JGF3_9PEZI|nr:hypothetical protein B0H65DRAFT_148681 [Neurospora tetraspora]
MDQRGEGVTPNQWTPFLSLSIHSFVFSLSFLSSFPSLSTYLGLCFALPFLLFLDILGLVTGFTVLCLPTLASPESTIRGPRAFSRPSFSPSILTSLPPLTKSIRGRHFSSMVEVVLTKTPSSSSSSSPSSASDDNTTSPVSALPRP